MYPKKDILLGEWFKGIYPPAKYPRENIFSGINPKAKSQISIL